jgi:hypothetical protein
MAASPSTKVSIDPKPTTPESAPKIESTAKSQSKARPVVPLVSTAPQGRWSWLTSPAFRIAVVLLFIAVAAVSIYYFTRETRLTINVAAGDIQVRPEMSVVFNFAGKVNLLRRDYQNRQQPLILQVDEQQLQLMSARGDLAGRQQRKKLLDDALEQYQKEIPQYLAQGQAALDTFWSQQGESLKQEYRTTLEGIHTEISQRAASLSIPYTRNTELDAPEVAANAFRLALYNAPAGVKVDGERKWVEELLARWKAFEKDWTEKQLQLKDRAMDIKKEPGPKVADAEDRINSLRQEIDALSVELKALEDEVATYEGRLEEAQQSLESTIDPFLRELLSVPDQFQKAALVLPASGVLELRQIQERSDLAPGIYTLMIRGTKEGQEYWALKEFDIKAYQANAVSVGPDDFVLARSYLKSK